LKDSSSYLRTALFRSQNRYSESHAVIITVKLVLTGDEPWSWATGPTRSTTRSLNTVRTDSTAGPTPKACVLTLARMVIRSPTWT